jgi:hypothetical protein
MPLNSQETIQYLTHKIELCGAPISAVITEDAIRLVHRATDGVPRLIDQVVDSALRIAAELKQRPISVQIIEAAWARSQQLPLPWSDKAQSISDSPTTIEFGLLEDDTEQDFRGRDTSYVHQYERNVSPNQTNDDKLYGKIDESKNSFTPQATYDSDIATYEESIGLTSKPPQHLPPVPSAGSGLSRSISNAWDSFVESAPKASDDSLDYSVDHSNEHLLTQASNQSPTYAQSFDVEPADNYPQYGSGVQNSTVANDIFGMDYEEELWLSEPSASTIQINAPSQSQPHQIISQMAGATQNGLDVPIEVVSDDTIDKLLYAFRDAPQQHSNALGQAEFRKVGAYKDETESALELLDQISSVNLEAMTMSTQDSSGVMNGITNHQEPTLEVVTENSVVRSPKSSFGGMKSAHATLSRPPRPSILSFAEMQNESSELIRDDRDLLVIEEDVLQMNAGVPVGSSHDSMSQASVHPYKQLFSKLRG